MRWSLLAAQTEAPRLRRQIGSSNSRPGRRLRRMSRMILPRGIDLDQPPIIHVRTVARQIVLAGAAGEGLPWSRLHGYGQGERARQPGDIVRRKEKRIFPVFHDFGKGAVIGHQNGGSLLERLRDGDRKALVPPRGYRQPPAAPHFRQGDLARLRAPPVDVPDFCESPAYIGRFEAVADDDEAKPPDRKSVV